MTTDNSKPLFLLFQGEIHNGSITCLHIAFSPVFRILIKTVLNQPNRDFSVKETGLRIKEPNTGCSVSVTKVLKLHILERKLRLWDRIESLPHSTRNLLDSVFCSCRWRVLINKQPSLSTGSLRFSIRRTRIQGGRVDRTSVGCPISTRLARQCRTLASSRTAGCMASCRVASSATLASRLARSSGRARYAICSLPLLELGRESC